MQLKALLEPLRNIGWTIKIIPGLKQEISVLHFNALDALRLSFVGSLVFLVTLFYFVVGGTQERSSVQVLSKSLQMKDAQLRTVENQKLQMENLLSQKTGQMEEHLYQMRMQEEDIRKLLQGKHRTGMKAGRRVAVEPDSFKERMRFAQRSSRGGAYNELVRRLSALDRRIGEEQFALDQVKQTALLRRERIEAERQKLEAVFDRVPSLWPVLGEVTSRFGYRVHPIDGEGEFHRGLDIAAGYASPIRAAAGGTCVYADYKSGFGLTVLIDHKNGLTTQYSHCSKIMTHPGALLRKGDVVALVGTTGYSTGPHVHFEIHYHDTPVNPESFLGLSVDELADRGGIRKLVSNR